MSAKLVDGPHTILKCSSCGKRLADIWVTRPQINMIFKYRARCCYCQDCSFPVELKGGVAYAGICETNLTSDSVDDWRAYTTIESVEWGNGIVDLITKKI